MNITRGTQRIIIGTLAAFYLITGGFYVSHLIPYQSATSAIKQDQQNIETGNFDAPRSYQDDDTRNDILNMDYHESEMSTWGSVLIWGTLAFAIGGAIAWWSYRGFKPAAKREETSAQD